MRYYHNSTTQRLTLPNCLSLLPASFSGKDSVMTISFFSDNPYRVQCFSLKHAEEKQISSAYNRKNTLKKHKRPLHHSPIFPSSTLPADCIPTKKDDQWPPFMFSQRNNPYCDLLKLVRQRYSILFYITKYIRTKNVIRIKVITFATLLL